MEVGHGKMWEEKVPSRGNSLVFGWYIQRSGNGLCGWNEEGGIGKEHDG